MTFGEKRWRVRICIIGRLNRQLVPTLDETAPMGERGGEQLLAELQERLGLKRHPALPHDALNESGEVYEQRRDRGTEAVPFVEIRSQFLCKVRDLLL